MVLIFHLSKVCTCFKYLFLLLFVAAKPLIGQSRSNLCFQSHTFALYSPVLKSHFPITPDCPAVFDTNLQNLGEWNTNLIIWDLHLARDKQLTANIVLWGLMIRMQLLCKYLLSRWRRTGFRWIEFFNFTGFFSKPKGRYKVNEWQRTTEVMFCLNM